ncbi:MAG: hypothetical protein ACI9H8_000469 [Lysobacterales bacterium]|jgi:hypothetical protein
MTISHIHRIFPIAASTLLLTACSAAQTYESLQGRERNLCAQGPQVQYEGCKARVAMSYEEYSRQEAESVKQPAKLRNEPIKTDQVKRFVDAFNEQDVSAMLVLTTHDVRWMSVNGDQVSVETSSSTELRQAMLDYFQSRPSSLSLLLDTQVDGPFVTTLEQAGTTSRRGQCATAVYEFSGDLIRNVWYYPAHDCEDIE